MPKKRWSPAEIMKVLRLREPRLAPDNQSILYSATAMTQTDAGIKHISSIYLSSTDGSLDPILLTLLFFRHFLPAGLQTENGLHSSQIVEVPLTYA